MEEDLERAAFRFSRSWPEGALADYDRIIDQYELPNIPIEPFVQVLYACGRFEDAYQILETEGSQQGQPHLRSLLGRAAASTGRFDQAKGIARTLLKERSDYEAAAVQIELLKGLKATGELTEMMSTLSGFGAGDASNLLVSGGIALFHLGEANAAVKLWERAIDLKAGSADPFRCIAGMAYTPKSLPLIREAFALEPLHRDVLFVYFNVALKERVWSEAEQTLSALIRDDLLFEQDKLRFSAFLQFRQGDFRRAADTASAALGEQPNDLGMARVHMWSSFRQGRVIAAAKSALSYAREVGRQQE